MLSRFYSLNQLEESNITVNHTLNNFQKSLESIIESPINMFYLEAPFGSGVKTVLVTETLKVGFDIYKQQREDKLCNHK